MPGIGKDEFHFDISFFFFYPHSLHPAHTIIGNGIPKWVTALNLVGYDTRGVHTKKRLVASQDFQLHAHNDIVTNSLCVCVYI